MFSTLLTWPTLNTETRRFFGAGHGMESRSGLFGNDQQERGVAETGNQKSLTWLSVLLRVRQMLLTASAKDLKSDVSV